MNKNFVQYLIHPTRFWVRLDQKGIIHLNDEAFLKWLFKWKLGYTLNLENPKIFNEKIQWLKHNDKQERYTSLVDKYEAKKVVGSIIGNEFIIPTLGVWNTFDEIDFESLPNQFVLKITHVVRIDFFKTREGFKFSEMTFYHWCGHMPFSPRSYDLTFGEHLQLPEKRI